jgi:hypothetical protein
MINQVIYIIIAIVLFCIVAYGMKWVCTSFALPQPVLWLCGALLLIVLLLALAAQFGGGPSLFLKR